jgi:hypothetical protein
MKMKQIRNIAVSGVDSQEKYDQVCDLVGDESGIFTSNMMGRVAYDDGDREVFMHFWDEQAFSHCTLYTYEDFIAEYGEKKCDGKWNDYYIEASQEAYDLLVSDGYEDRYFNSFIGRKGSLSNFYLFIHDGFIDSVTYGPSANIMYIVDGKLSATQYHPDEVAFSAFCKKEVCDSNDLEIEELKAKYATGKYDVYVFWKGCQRSDLHWWRNINKKFNPYSFSDGSKYKLILKEHSYISDALISNPKTTCYFFSDSGKMITENVNDFFKSYSEHIDYKLERTEKQASKDAFTVTEDESFIVGTQYKHLKCDTVEWSKQNHTLEQQKAICQFMLNKYSMREKGQDIDDIVKIKFYVNWLEDIVKG